MLEKEEKVEKVITVTSEWLTKIILFPFVLTAYIIAAVAIPFAYVGGYIAGLFSPD